MSITGSEQWMYSAGASFYDHLIDQSVRITSGGSLKNDTVASTTRTYDSSQIFTYSCWFKPQGNGVHLISLNDTPATGEFTILYDNDNTFRVYSNGQFDGDTTAVFRDFSAWYHVCLVMDTTQATAANRARLYINGTLHALSSQPSQNLNVRAFTTATRGAIGARYQDNGTINYQGTNGAFHIAEFIYADGVKHEPTVFGETKSGVWIPKDVSSISLGTNGYHLDFSDQTLNTSITTNSGFGKDVRSNMPNPQWITQGNLAVHDGMPDSPTVNYAVVNPLARSAQDFRVTLSEGNLNISAVTNSDSNFNTRFATIPLPSSGKYYAECRTYVISSNGNQTCFGVVNPDAFDANEPSSKTLYNFADGEGFDGFNMLLNPNTAQAYSGGATSGSQITGLTATSYILKLALDIDNGKVFVGYDGVWLNSADPAAGSGEIATRTFTTSDVIAITTVSNASGNNNGSWLNFGQDSTFGGNVTAGGNSDANGYGDFAYAVPSGFLALNSANLPEPAISPMGDELPEDYFNTRLYSGNSSTQSVTGVGFQPDWLWLKSRTTTNSHVLVDSVRGSGSNGLFYLSTSASNGTGEEVDGTNITSLDSDGFTLGSNVGTNGSGRNFVSWNWLAGGTAVNNTDGSITSSVSANTKAGFSIVSFAVPASGTFTIGHGLNAKPAMIITKGRDLEDNWATYHKSISTDENTYVLLNKTDGSNTATDIWGTAQPTTTVMGMKAGTTLLANQEAIAYCFAEIEGYSKFGSYTGSSSNSSTDNTFVYTGFRPAWVMVKQTNGTGSWHMYDNKRGSSNEADPTVTNNNVVNKILYANVPPIEVTFTTMDFVSNGFKFRTNQADISGSNQSYIYMAFAEMPQKYANAR